MPDPIQDKSCARPRFIIWDPLCDQPEPGLFDLADEALFFDPSRSLGFHSDQLRAQIEMLPWVHIVAAGRWVPVLVDLSTRYLHLCIGSAVFHQPVLEVSDGRERLTLGSAPLPFPSFTTSPGQPRLRRKLELWGSAPLVAAQGENPWQTLSRAACQPHRA
ncbi:hypothetical protein [Paracoccus aminophilus]|nr:hypothetical protein [Paracoccus aminophilus]